MRKAAALCIAGLSAACANPEIVSRTESEVAVRWATPASTRDAAREVADRACQPSGGRALLWTEEVMPGTVGQRHVTHFRCTGTSYVSGW